MAVDQRDASYILENPDLVIATNDGEVTRCLFEIRSNWLGARHARLVIANTLTGDKGEASCHVSKAYDWIEHEIRKKKNRSHDDSYEPLDIVALPFFMITNGRVQDAAPYLRRWLDWYAFEVCEHLFDYAHFAQAKGVQSKYRFNSFINSLTALGHIAAALSFSKFAEPKTRELIKKLSRRCRAETKPLLLNNYRRDRTYDIEDGLRKSSALALALGLKNEAITILLRARHNRPALWLFKHSHDSMDIFRFIFRTALVAAAKGNDIHEKDLLPKELVPIFRQIPKHLTGKDFRDKAKNRLSKIPRKLRGKDANSGHSYSMSDEDNQGAERFLNVQLEPLLSLTKALSSALAASSHQIGRRFVQLVEEWENARKTNDPYRKGGINLFFQFLGLEAVLFVLWTREELKETSIQRFLIAVHAHGVATHNLIQIISILARRLPLKDVAGSQVHKACTLIQDENDVTERANLYAHLSRAMLPASHDEASQYFRKGLKQMDAIGSNDYKFTNELLIFASTIKGDELDEKNFHTLSNIVELNLGDEPDEFLWGDYGRGLAKVAGLRGLAKLSRWDDRDRISLAHTLLPYLIGLLEHNKITPLHALALNRLANPVEGFQSGIKEFANSICRPAGPNPKVMTALIEQYRDNNPGTWAEDTTAKLSSLADEALGTSSDLARFLKVALPHHARINDTLNGQRNYNNAHAHWHVKEKDQHNRQAFDRIIANTDPADESSLVQAITDFNKLKDKYTLKNRNRFFAKLRTKLDYAKRGDYLRHVCKLEHLFYYWKLTELKQAKDAWSQFLGRA